MNLYHRVSQHIDIELFPRHPPIQVNLKYKKQHGHIPNNFVNEYSNEAVLLLIYKGTRKLHFLNRTAWPG